jgi:hypothetical protein
MRQTYAFLANGFKTPTKLSLVVYNQARSNTLSDWLIARGFAPLLNYEDWEMVKGKGETEIDL